MADNEKIVQEVEIKTVGADEAASEFEKLGDAADKAFTDVAKGADAAAESLTKLSDSAEQGFAAVQEGSAEAVKGTEDITAALLKLANEAGAGLAKGFGDVFKPLGDALDDFTGGGFSKIGESISNTVSNLGKFRTAVEANAGPLSELGSVIAGTGPKFATYGESVAATVAILGRLGPVGFAAAAALASLSVVSVPLAATFFEIAKGAAETAENMRIAGVQFGATSAEMAGLKKATELAGGSFGAVERALAVIEEGGKRVSEMFDELGISMTDSAGKTKAPIALYRELAQKVGEMSSGVEASGTVISGFGARLGRNLVAPLREGVEGLDAGTAAVNRFGLVFNDETDQIGKDFSTALGNLGDAVKGIFFQIGITIAPFFTSILNGLTSVVVGARELGSLLTLPFREAVSSITGFIGSLVTLIGKIGSLIAQTPGVKELAAGFEFLKGSLPKDFTFGSAVKASVTSLIPGIAGLTTAFNVLKLIIDNLNGEQEKSADGFKKVGDAADDAGKKVQNYQDALNQKQPEGSAGTQIQEISVLDKVYGQVAESAAEAAQRIKDANQSLDEHTGTATTIADLQRMAEELRNVPEAAKEIAPAVKSAFDSVATDAGTTGTQAAANFKSGFVVDVTDVSSAIESQLQPLVTKGTEIGKQVGTEIGTNVATGLGSSLENVPTDVQTSLQPIVTQGAQVGKDTGSSIGTNIGPSLLESLSTFDFSGALDGLKNAMSTVGSDIGNALKNALSGAITAIRDFGSAGETAGQTINTSMNSAGTSVRTLGELASAAADQMERLARAADQVQQSSASRGGGFARGGHVYGAGTSTSDSIPAWLSHGEWVIQAKAVRKYGHSFMAALNSMRLPKDMLSKILSQGFSTGGFANHFAMGGPVGMPSISLAGGGSATDAQTVVNLTIGRETFNGMIAPKDVADKLVRFAVNERVRSAGRKPGWYTGHS